MMIETINGDKITVEVHDDNIYQGIVVLVNGQQVARIEADDSEEAVSCYVWGNAEQEDITHKINLEGY